MSLAMKRLKNLGWLALVFMVAILLYPLSLNVAALHSDLVAVDRQILDTKREISFLQAEIRTRASLQQLEEWNELLYGYQPPTAQQFINGEAALAGLGNDVPVTRPVMVAVGDAPAGIVGGGAHSTSSLAATDDEDTVTETAVKVAVAKIDPPKVEQSRTERLAKMDEKLLSDDLMRDISLKADKERRR
ncbi:MAG: hypothetical protein IBJ12_04340 [Sphingomonadaceae bacterium]|nr:hypothetical protein [Sphingomonadaceae bacterium]